MSSIREFVDANLELGLMATIAGKPDLYWELRDLLPDGAFEVHRDLWTGVVKAVESESEIPKVTRKARVDGVLVDEPVPPLRDPQLAARKLADLYRRRLLVRLHQHQLERLKSDDPAESLIAESESALAKVAQSVRETGADALQWGSDLMGIVLQDARAARDRKEQTGSTVAGIPTGFVMFDKEINGLNEGVYIPAAPPGFGKTTFVLKISCHVALQYPVIYVTYENSPANLVLKSMCRLAGISSTDVEKGDADLDKLNEGAVKFSEIAPRIAFIEGSARTTAAMVQAKALQAMRHHNAQRCLVIIDYVQKMAQQLGRQSLRENVSFLSTELRDMSRRLKSPIIAISSLNRQAYEGGRSAVFMDGLKESGDLEFSADVVMFLTDGEKSDSPDVRNITLKVAKNRYGANDIEAFFKFRPAIGDFTETCEGY